MKTIILLAAGLLLCATGFSQNVGIGTTTPGFKLDVRNGSINTDSVYRIRTNNVLAVTDIGNLFVGKYAGNINTGSYNTFCGDRPGIVNTTGSHNSFFGFSTGFSNSTGDSNSFFGVMAGIANTNGNYNSFFGHRAGSANTTGTDNSFFGVSSGEFNTTGSYNSFFGRIAGRFNTSGWNNTTVGFNANVSAIGVINNATAIGAFAVVDASAKVRIGSTSVTSIGGQVGWSTFSDGRFKHQVQEDVQGLAFIKKLRTLSYLVDHTALDNYYSAENSEIGGNHLLQQNINSQPPELYRQSGFIAQEVELAAKELGFLFSGIDKPTNEKALYGLRYGDFVVPLVKAVQEQQLIIETLQKQVEAAKAEIPMQIGKQQIIIEEQNKKIEMLIKEITLIKEKLR